MAQGDGELVALARRHSLLPLTGNLRIKHFRGMVPVRIVQITLTARVGFSGPAAIALAIIVSVRVRY
jgi:hypothetical protein